MVIALAPRGCPPCDCRTPRVALRLRHGAAAAEAALTLGRGQGSFLRPPDPGPEAGLPVPGLALPPRLERLPTPPVRLGWRLGPLGGLLPDADGGQGRRMAEKLGFAGKAGPLEGA